MAHSVLFVILKLSLHFSNTKDIPVERTLIIVKPDGVQRGLTGEIIRRFEQRGLRIIGMKFMHVSQELAEKHYAVHKERPFFAGLVQYITSSPVVAIALEGTNAIAAARMTIGSTKPFEAAAGSIRGDLALEVGRNLVHGSDSVENGQIEVANFFSEGELFSAWARNTDPWIFENAPAWSMKHPEDDLIIIEGIGPKSKDALYADGITSFAQVASMTPAQLFEVVADKHGVKLIKGQTESWPKQAALLAKGDMDAFKKLTDELTAGR
jgi:nucleoside-diphosphate kinase